VPHWIYNIFKNYWYITLWISKDTSDFNCDCIEKRREEKWKYEYSNASSLLLLMDWWWSNSSRSYLVKDDLQKLTNKIWIPIRVAHYPPYTSKYNPIEHKLFCHVSRACEWVVFTSIEVVKTFMKNTKTKTWLKVDIRINNNEYKKWRTLNAKYKSNLIKKITFDKENPRRNYGLILKMRWKNGIK